MTVVHEQGEVKGKASATLDGNFPLNVAINAKTKLGDTPQELSVAAAGALDDLTLSVVARGAVTANANLMANILDSNLPIEFTANWQEQAIPTLENTTLKEGQLTLSGTMGDYVLKGAGAATLPDIGNVPVSLDVVLKKNNILLIGQYNALDGLNNTGTLYLNESIAWEGKTTLRMYQAHQHLCA